MFFRSHRLDCFRYNFARYVLASIFIVGCLLLMTVFSDSRKSHPKDIDAFQNHRIVELSTDRANAVWDPHKGESALLFHSNGPGTRLQTDDGTSIYINQWEEENFPDVHATPRVNTILETFRRKVALNDRKLINLFDYNYIHNMPQACQGRQIELVVAIPSWTGNFEARQAIRETWGQYASNSANNAVVLFFLGAARDQETQTAIDSEALKYEDIIQESFIDSYRNLSLKTTSLLKWVSTFCQDSVFLLKSDDDMYVNVPRLVEKLQEQIKRGPVFIMGAVHHNTEPFRDQKNKWFVTREEYPWKIFPNYMSGTAYAMTTSAAMRLYVESLYVKGLFLEDVYITGLVADRAAVPRVGEAEFSWNKLEPYGCIFQYKISGHKNTPRDLRKIHRELYDPDLKCF